MPGSHADEVEQLCLGDVVALHHQTDHRVAQYLIERGLGTGLSVASYLYWVPFVG
jgi:hypothetical protein